MITLHYMSRIFKVANDFLQTAVALSPWEFRGTWQSSVVSYEQLGFF